ncbi:hypothetical protein AKJ09_11100 [Labilithrix luteola]|uniref:Uncharacterized protein n=1 Tax=Labilithrix luteola TaxID=1391654 RepID=A0A0K1QFK5_9BACT|nr:hypothetical protein [Labilithrix luteola]AKV04437.1 hypothetical protein AKJ09_11100 [Labilithrix luteola]
MGRRVFVLATSLLGLVIAPTAHAQTSTPAAADGPVAGPPGPPRMVSIFPVVPAAYIAWLDPHAGGDAAQGGQGDVNQGALDAIRLGLYAQAPVLGGMFAECRSAGPSIEQTAGIRLVPQLTLYGFSRSGCAIDQAVGGALVFTLPVSRTVSLSLSASQLYVPNAVLGVPKNQTQIRADATFALPEKRSLSLGVSTGRGSPRVTFGGVF